MAETYEGLTIKFGADVSEFNNAITDVDRSLRELKSQQTALNKALRFDTGNYDLLQKKLENLEKQYDVVKKSVDENEKALKNFGAVTSDNVAEWDKLNNAFMSGEAELNRLATQINKIKNKPFEDISNSLSKIQANAEKVAKALTPLSTLTAGALTAGVKSAIDYESAFAGVAKTVEATDEQLEEISDGIIKLSTEMPASAESIAQVAENAGQLGIASDDILDFSETMIKLDTATNLTADDASTMIAQFANVTGMEGDYDRLGSALVALGNDGASTESQIMELAQRLSGAGATAGLTEQDILALGAAMANVGINAEAGGTAMSTFISNLESYVAKGGDDLEAFAEVAGLSAEEFAEQWETEPVIAIEKFLTGLGQIDDNGGSAIVTLQDLGITETRQRDMLLRLANAEGQLSHALDVSNTAWDENLALNQEFDKFNATLASGLERVKNMFTDIARTLGENLTPYVEIAVEKLESLYDWFKNLTSEQQNIVAMIGVVTSALAPATLAFSRFSGVLSKAFKLDDKGQTQGIVKMVQNLASGVGNIFKSGFGLSGLGDIGKNIAKALGDAFSNSKVGSSILSGLSDAIAGISGKIGTVLNPIKNAFSSVWTELTNNQVIQMVLGQMSSKISSFTSTIANFFKPLTSSISTLASGLGSMLPLAIAGLIASFAYLFATNDEFRQSVLDLVSGIMEVVQPLIDWVKSFVMDTLVPVIRDQLLPIFEQIWNAIIPVIQNVLLPLLQNLVNFFVTYILPVLTSLFNLVMTYIVPVFQLFADVLTWLIDKVITPLYNWFSANILPIFNEVGEALESFLTPAIDALGDALDTVIGWVEDLWNWFTDLWSKIQETEAWETLKGIFDGISSVLGTIVDWVTKLISKLGEAASAVGDFFGSVGDFFGNLISSGGLGAQAEIMASGGVGIRNLSVQTTINVNNQGQPIGSDQIDAWGDHIADMVSYKLARRLP